MVEKYRYIGLGTKEGVIPVSAKRLPEYGVRTYMVYMGTEPFVKRVTADQLCEPFPGFESLIEELVGRAPLP